MKSWSSNRVAGKLGAMLIVCLLSFNSMLVFGAQDNSVIVLYPDAPSPYKEIFSRMITGVQLSTGYAIKKYALPKQYDISEIQQWLDGNKHSAKSLVVLSKRALLVSHQLRHNLKVFAGALDILPGKDNISGVSAHIDPAVYLSRLKQLTPKVQKLIVFYKAKDEPLIPIIDQAAEKYNITVYPIMLAGIEVAVSQIVNTMREVDPNTTAVWFSSNVIGLNAELLFPYILEQSWVRRIPVFSNMISDTRRGFLFSLYPNYQDVGYELGQLIKKHEIANELTGARLIQSAKFILNKRTAQHLGIELDAATLKTVDIIFPAK